MLTNQAGASKHAIKLHESRRLQDIATEMEEKFAAKAKMPAIFTTFKSSVTLPEGLTVIRSLGGGKYEVVNLRDVKQEDFGLENAAAMVNSVPERYIALQEAESECGSAQLKCSAVIRAIELDIFRLGRLPPELREKIFKYVVVNPNGLTYSNKQDVGCSGAALLSTCKDFYLEARKLFWTNNFHLPYLAIRELRTQHYFTRNIRVVTFMWRDRITDHTSFRDIAKYPQLEVLNVTMKHHNSAREVPFYTLRPRKMTNRLYQKDTSLELFSKYYGFDALLSIRGLKTATFTILELDSLNENKFSKQLVEKAQDALQALLMKNLTKPKLKAKRKVKKHRRRRGYFSRT